MKWKYQRHVEAETAEWESVVRSMSFQLIKDNKKQPIYKNLDLTEQSIESNKDVEQNLDIAVFDNSCFDMLNSDRLD